MANHAIFNMVQQLMDDDEEYLLLEQYIDLMQAAMRLRGAEKEDIIKILGYVNITVPRYPPDQFRTHYRLSRDAFDLFLHHMIPHLTLDNNGGGVGITPEKQLLMFVWYMANQDCFRELGHMFDTAISTVHAIVCRVSDEMFEHMQHLVHWPTLQEQEEMANDTDIEGLIGYIDGTHVRLPFRPQCDQDFINRKGFPSVQLQIVVDAKMRIISAYTGWPGCAHDARVLRNSGLYKNAERIGGGFFGPRKFIYGDSAYPLRAWLIKPVLDTGRMTPEQRAYNRRMSSLRQIVERVIGHLKGRFRRLTNIFLFKMEEISKIIFAACILHNLCIMSDDQMAEFIIPDNDQHPNNYEHVFGDNVDGEQLRNQIIQYVVDNP